jgi:hypothetical protein
MPLGLFDIFGPPLVIGHRINAQTDDLAVPLGELRLETRHVAQFGGANRREILWMRKQNGPPVANPFMKVDGPLRRLGSKIGSFLSDM